MKEVKMFMLESCPHCRKAREMITEIFSRHPEIELIRTCF